MDHQTVDMLSHVEKPARYTGGELNSVCKEGAEVDFALLFADTYEVGMSHLGLQILYEVLNDLPYVWAQRCYLPWVDMVAEMKKRGAALCSLEGNKPLNAFDIVGINLSYEMCYTNVLAMLEMGGIPLHADARTDDVPIVIGGGACTVNPEPLAAFFDAFVLGEGEEAVVEICALYRAHKQAGFDRQAFLQALAGIGGVYVPSLYDVSYADDGTVAAVTPMEGAPPVIKKRFVRDFDGARAARRPVLPYINTVHDRCVLEIMRGCANGCRFCQAGYAMRPVRVRGPERLISQAQDIISATGYDEIGLSSLSSGDYPDVGSLIDRLVEEFRSQRVSVSLPSLRVNTYDFARQLSQVRKTGLTFAPEAGTQRLRDVINKNISEQDILTAVSKAFSAGVNSVKLYFMIGLPTETYEDLDGIAELVKKIKDVYYDLPKERRHGRLTMTVSVSCFVPKACTPFQWEAMDSVETLRDKQFYLKDKLKIKGVRFQYHDAHLSFLEAVFARGDRRLACVIEYAYQNGAMFDAWQERFSMERYTQAFAACGIDPAFYAGRKRDTAEVLPWAHLSMLIDQSYLARELEKAYDAAVTADCAGACAGCGLQKEGCEMHIKEAGV